MDMQNEKKTPSPTSNFFTGKKLMPKLTPATAHHSNPKPMLPLDATA
jgi:hypothetical protein